MSAEISVGVVGCGYWGPLLVRNFKGLSDCRLKAVCDVSEARLRHLKALYSDVEGVIDYRGLLDGGKLLVRQNYKLLFVLHDNFRM